MNIFNDQEVKEYQEHYSPDEEKLEYLMENQEKVCKCGHEQMAHNFGGKYACYINYNQDGCLEFESTN